MDEGYYMNRTIHDFWRVYSLFVARAASFAPERSEGANDATGNINKLYTLQKSRLAKRNVLRGAVCHLAA